jgi:N-acetyl-anhydromuramyl-L-alanine amidase AmpD
LPGFADVQRRFLRVLVQGLIQKYCIPSTHLIRHKDTAPGKKTDPADSLWADFFPSYAAYQESYAAVQAVM